MTADFQAYREAHEAVADLYRNQDQWTRKAVINTASMGWFSSDRTIAEYAKEIWNAEPVSAGGLRTASFYGESGVLGHRPSTPRFMTQNTKAVCWTTSSLPRQIMLRAT